ncbi:hypothetical protein [Marinactinospora rubrisoli]|uniref:Uncharacterized protein n=1 Tax=Marinactinospora rubrisoli TaxID=2715399 RepID=A0ABW2KBI0_9ACTN
MPTAVFRALATLLIAVLFGVGASVASERSVIASVASERNAAASVASERSPSAAGERGESTPVPGTPAEHRTVTVGFGPHAVVGPAQDSASVSLALAKWGGDQRPVARDLADGYLPGQVGLPGRTGRWERVPPPVPAARTGVDDTGRLPQGRAPPPTTRT